MTAFQLEAVCGAARAGLLRTPHGDVHTPAFMPVGTHGTVRAVHPDEVRRSGAEIILCNAYHLALRPGVEVIADSGGVHRFSGWEGPILTDSGGFQLVSLTDIARVDDAGADFISPYDGTRLRVTPERALEIQLQLGADVLMCLDQPVPWPAEHAPTQVATERTHRWAERCLARRPDDGRLLFGIAQGGFDGALRAESARVISAMGFDGVAVGGLSVGEPHDVMWAMCEASLSAMPDAQPRYFMGLGTDAELLRAVSMGVDMFDCVLPTRLARNATALTAEGRLSLRNAQFRDDVRPIDAACDCDACKRFSRAYLRHLFAAGEILAHRLVSVHNLTHLGRLMRRIRMAIIDGTLASLEIRGPERVAVPADR